MPVMPVFSSAVSLRPLALALKRARVYERLRESLRGAAVPAGGVRARASAGGRHQNGRQPLEAAAEPLQVTFA